ncbi:hypothetical protein O6H91_22G024000 [Diphasiastrum complanatum]|uniref:Uncharacterized protein n=1 Tax=Diphasiastrum complanatum TaxID=34168 RepID=A0ACC2ADS7_DIPCM|nr:hypothetical protein O6H91_22G024000 [Diphasiastrum complanatum]
MDGLEIAVGAGRARRVLREKNNDNTTASDDSGEMEKQQHSAAAPASSTSSEQEARSLSTSHGPSHTDLEKENRVASCFPGLQKTTMASESILKLKEGLHALQIKGTKSSLDIEYTKANLYSQVPKMPRPCEAQDPLKDSESQSSEKEKVSLMNDLAKSLSGTLKSDNSYLKLESSAKVTYDTLSQTKAARDQQVASLNVAKTSVEAKNANTTSAAVHIHTKSISISIKDQPSSSCQTSEHSIGCVAPSSASNVYSSQSSATSSSSSTGGIMVVSEKQVSLCGGQAHANTSEASRNAYANGQHPAVKSGKDEVDLPLERGKKVPSALGISTSNDRANRAREGGARKAGENDHFVWVNNCRYQKLGKIGSGGSSDVYKVISQDCTIFALKKIKLKGRDRQTACGFHQEIEYLQRLSGKRHIIKLVDYQVSDKKIFEDSNAQQGEIITEDAFIYMVLEYGEIDLAHMLDHKKKEMSERNQQLDENWLRLYLELKHPAYFGSCEYYT